MTEHQPDADIGRYGSDGLDGRRVLITGAAGGLGAACTEAVLAAGATVVMSDLDGRALEEAAGRVRSQRPASDVRVVAADLSTAAGAAACVAEVEDRAGAMYGVVACAGVMQIKPFLDIDADDWDRVLSVNLTGTFFRCPGCRPRDAGC